MARLTVQGTNLVDNNGKIVMLRGWNWGRWGMTQPGDAAQNVAEGANVVRIPLRWWGYYDAPNIDSRDDTQTSTARISAAHLAILDDMVAQASAAGLWIDLFVDSNCGQNGTQDAAQIAYCDPTGSYPKGHNFWTDPDARAKFIEVWKFVASRYKSTPKLGLFEPLPEPNPSGAGDAAITAFYDELMTAIRSVAPGIPFIIGPRSYTMKQVDGAYNAAWSDVVYTGNLFVHMVGTDDQVIADLGTRLDVLLKFRTDHGKPVFIQQAGVKSSEDPNLVYLNALMPLMNTNNVGYTYWSYRDDTYAGGYGVIYRSGNTWVTKTNFMSVISNAFKQ